ncbi:MAG: AtpZ/AtpI family protein [Peptoniphilus sp.]|nr:AtpZ/AtpI family protein [Peptoniphilus sp.]MDD7363215.1 AtpZ/AtpI family protein [Bacillota bacterium]MDY6044461.1 AtpZ/AtpI family protein [Peptoniphilus sp.]
MKKSPYSGLALITQVGLNVIVPILGCMLFGMWLDKKLGTDGILLLIFTLIGVAAGIGNILRLGKKL